MMMKMKEETKMSEQDENLKKAKQAADLAVMQEKARVYQQKLLDLQNKEYQGKYKGLNLRMKGNYEVIDVKIDQSFYETAGKQEIEQAILVAYVNLHRAIETEQKELQDEMTNELQRMQVEAFANGNN
jgi:DNA-binding protein YbaB